MPDNSFIDPFKDILKEAREKNGPTPEKIQEARALLVRLFEVLPLEVGAASEVDLLTETLVSSVPGNDAEKIAGAFHEIRQKAMQALEKDPTQTTLAKVNNALTYAMGALNAEIPDGADNTLEADLHRVRFAVEEALDPNFQSKCGCPVEMHSQFNAGKVLLETYKRPLLPKRIHAGFQPGAGWKELLTAHWRELKAQVKDHLVTPGEGVNTRRAVAIIGGTASVGVMYLGVRNMVQGVKTALEASKTPNDANEEENIKAEKKGMDSLRQLVFGGVLTVSGALVLKKLLTGQVSFGPAYH